MLTKTTGTIKKTPLLISAFKHKITPTSSPKILPLYHLPYGMKLKPNSQIQPCFQDFDVKMSKEASNAQFKRKLNTLFPTKCELYMDGSKTDEGEGCVVYDSHTDKTKLDKLE